MVFQEPKVEFVPINLSIDALSDQSQAGVETCTGPLAPSNVCSYNNAYWLDENGNVYDPQQN